jgi:hypothetical protein
MKHVAGVGETCTDAAVLTPIVAFLENSLLAGN